MGVADRPSRVLRALLVAVLAATLLLAPSLSPAATLSKVTSIRYWSGEGYTRVVIALSENAKFTKNIAKNPERLYIDLKGARALKSILRTQNVDDGLLTRIRAGQFDGETVRVVLDIKKISEHKVFMLTDPPRVVVDVFGAPKIKRTGVKRIVVDAGHGGRDPGAIGVGKLKEKDITLDIARRVRRILKQKGYDVALTRDRDKYISLEERTVVANSRDADLFISIHTNAHRSRKIRGMETYLLNWTDDAQALKVAARENRISVKRMKQSRSDVGVILASLELQNKRDESLKLAHLVQDSMVGSVHSRYSRINDLGVKQALFYVLLGARMPSVLVEVAFITNSEEAKRMRNSAYKERLAQGIASGVEKYFLLSDGGQKVALR